MFGVAVEDGNSPGAGPTGIIRDITIRIIQCAQKSFAFSYILELLMKQKE